MVVAEGATANGSGRAAARIDIDTDRAAALLARVHDAQKDALHILPLSAIPLSTAALQKWHLMKNVRLETVIEVYNVNKTTHGQIAIGELSKYIDDRDNLLKDIPVLKKLGSLPSFDVYTLRIQLRRLGIAVTGADQLQLSEAKRQELLHFMREFTRPLIQKVFGGEGASVTDFDQLIAMFSQPDRGEALRNLKLLADRLQVGLTEIPNFLEEYGDIALSMAYFRGIFSDIEPLLAEFVTWSRETAESFRFREDAKFQQKHAMMLAMLDEIGKSVSAILDGFDKTAKSFWEGISMESFRSMRDTITDQHAIIGGSLCGLHVTTDAWQQQFRGKRASADKCADFIHAEMFPGLSAVKRAASPPAPKPSPTVLTAH
ncbi:MAG: hypothetical protein HYR63_09620 [Proteobacteria bacterium]|nr:hypothetical protein [Pseudomonadota bacterium]